MAGVNLGLRHTDSGGGFTRRWEGRRAQRGGGAGRRVHRASWSSTGVDRPARPAGSPVARGHVAMSFRHEGVVAEPVHRSSTAADRLRRAGATTGPSSRRAQAVHKNSATLLSHSAGCTAARCDFRRVRDARLGPRLHSSSRGRRPLRAGRATATRHHYGFLVGEVIRRVTGSPVHEWSTPRS